MAVTAADLIEMRELGLRLLTGDPGTTLRWAHAVELADPAPWLQGGELVLTTGLRLRTGAGQRAYVDRLADAHVAGLGFGVGLGHQRVPSALVDRCAERGLVLLEVPLPTPFLAISQAVADRLAEQAGAAVRQALDHQHRMARAALHTGVAGVARCLAAALSAAVVVADAHHHVLAAAPGDGVTLLARARAEIGTGAGPLGLRVCSGDDHLLATSLGVGGTRQGLLVVATDHPLDHTGQLLLTHAAALLSLELERPRAVLEAQRDLRSAVLGVLLDGHLDAAVAEKPLRHFGFTPGDRLVVLLVTASRPDPAPRIEACLATHPHLLAVRDDGVVVLVRAADERAAIAALDLPDATIGVSGATTAAGLPAALRAAAQARSRRTRIGRFTDHRLTALLGSADMHAAVRHLADDLLTPLADHPELLRSLEAFLRHNGAWETAARALGVHRHTLRHRMTQVAALTGTDLEAAQDRAALLLALLARQL